MSFSMWQKLSAPITASTVPPAAVRPAVVSLTLVSCARDHYHRRALSIERLGATVADRVFVVTPTKAHGCQRWQSRLSMP